MPLLELGEGVYKSDPQGAETTVLKDFLAQHKNSHNVTIRGKGPGVTEVHGKIQLNKWYPNLHDFAMYPGADTNWSMIEINNPGTFLISNLWVHPAAGSTGLSVRATDDGIIPEQIQWPPRNAPIGGSRITVSMIRDFYAYGAGQGLSVLNQQTQPSSNGQFVNHTRIDGGHIFTDDTAMRLSGAANVISNFHIDVKASGKGLRFGDNTFITWYCPGTVEPSSAIKNNGGQWINGPMENFTAVNWPVGVSYPVQT